MDFTDVKINVGRICAVKEGRIKENSRLENEGLALELYS